MGRLWQPFSFVAWRGSGAQDAWDAKRIVSAFRS